MKQKNIDRLEILTFIFLFFTAVLLCWGIMANNFKMTWYSIMTLHFFLLSIFLLFLYIKLTERCNKPKEGKEDSP